MELFSVKENEYVVSPPSTQPEVGFLRVRMGCKQILGRILVDLGGIVQTRLAVLPARAYGQ